MAKPEPVTVILEEPIKAWGKEINALVASHKLTAGDREMLDPLEKTSLLLKAIQLIYRTEDGKPLEMVHVRAIDGDDLDRLEEAAVPFVQTPSPLTGESATRS
jgi:hypothetical protein